MQKLQFTNYKLHDKSANRGLVYHAWYLMKQFPFVLIYLFIHFRFKTTNQYCLETAFYFNLPQINQFANKC